MLLVRAGREQASRGCAPCGLRRASVWASGVVAILQVDRWFAATRGISWNCREELGAAGGVGDGPDLLIDRIFLFVDQVFLFVEEIVLFDEEIFSSMKRSFS